MPVLRFSLLLVCAHLLIGSARAAAASRGDRKYEGTLLRESGGDPTTLRNTAVPGLAPPTGPVKCCVISYQGSQHQPLFITEHDEQGRMVRMESFEGERRLYTNSWTYSKGGFVSSFAFVSHDPESKERGIYRATYDEPSATLMETLEYVGREGAESTRRLRHLYDADGTISRTIRFAGQQEVLAWERRTLAPGVELIERYKDSGEPTGYTLRRYDKGGNPINECTLNGQGVILTLRYYTDIDTAKSLVQLEELVIRDTVAVDLDTLADADPATLYWQRSGKPLKTRMRSTSITEKAFDREILSTRYMSDGTSFGEIKHNYETDEHGNWTVRATESVGMSLGTAGRHRGPIIVRQIEYW